MVDKDYMLRGSEMVPSHGMCTVKELLAIYDIARCYTTPINWVELGVWCGRSIWAAGCGLPQRSRLFGIDNFDAMLPIHEGAEECKKFEVPGLQKQIAFTVADALWPVNQCECSMFQDSTEVAVRDFDDHYIDVLVVDACHTYEAVQQDIENWTPKVKPGGLILLHDYTEHYPGVRKAVQQRFDSVELIPGTRYAKVRV